MKSILDTVLSSVFCLWICFFSPPNKSSKGQEGFEKWLFLHDQSIRNTKTPSQIPAQHSSSSHPIFALCLPSSVFLLSSEHVSQPGSVNHHCQNSSCTEVSTELFYAEKPPLNVSKICRSITAREMLPVTIVCLSAIPPPKAGGLVRHCWACYLTAGTARARRPRSIPLRWNETHFSLGSLFGVFIFWHGIWPASMSIV